MSMEEVVQVAFQEETVKKPPEISREIKDKILEEVNLVISAFSNFVTLHLDCEEQGPLLNILSIKSDPFYVDQSVLHANITVLDTSQLLFSYLTPNREIYGDKIVINDVATELPSLLDKLSQTNLISCTGFNWQDPRLGTLFQRIRKSDIDWSLIEKFNGQVVYRSRTCKYVCPELSANTEHPFFTSQCFDCQNYLRELDKKYMGGKILETISEEASSQDVAVNVTDEIDTIVAAEGIDSDSKPKRGRPKGSKNRIYVRSSEIGECKLEENDENSDPSMAVDVIDGDRILVNSDDPDFIYGTEDITLEEESPAESKINLHKGFRKRITTKRQKALLETKRKRGRPPIKVGPIDCSDCEKIFDTVKDWRKHILEHKNSFACSFGDCVKRFKCQKDLEVHLRKHRGEKPYVCSECDKAYAIRQDLRLHIRTQHTGARPYKCEMCPKAFARAHQLAVHVPVHTGERAHLCSECGNSFSSVSSLIDHRKRRHQLQRDHKCQTCPKAFYTKNELITHIRTHTGDKPYQCQTCGKCFSRPHHRKRHEQGVHNRDRSKIVTNTANPAPAKIYIRDQDYTTADTVLFTTDEMVETVLIKEGDYQLGTETGPFVIQRQGGSKEPPQFAANSLLQLSQAKPEDDEEATVIVDPDSVIEIPGQEGGFVFVTTADNEQKLMPISQLSNFIQTTSASNQE